MQCDSRGRLLVTLPAGQIEKSYNNSAAGFGLVRKRELGEDRVDVLFNRPSAQDEIGRDGGITLALCDSCEYRLPLA